MGLDPRVIRAPEFPPVEWLNQDPPPSLAGLRGHPVLLEVWDFTCINCLRTLPVWRDWNTRYREAGLRLVGIHTPEFDFARNPALVRAACGRLGVTWPVALDPDQEIWTSLANAVWPTTYLIDPDGYLRFRHPGEGGYREIEAAVRALLVEAGASPTALPPESDPPPDLTGAACFPATPELQSESLGNGLATVDHEPTDLVLPDHAPEGAFYLGGSWGLANRGWTLASGAGEIVLPFQAESVHAVLSPFAGVEPAPPSGVTPVYLEVRLNGTAIAPGRFGEDLIVRREGTAVLVDSPRAYALVRELGPGRHELRLRAEAPGLTLYAFSFGACPVPKPPGV